MNITAGVCVLLETSKKHNCWGKTKVTQEYYFKTVVKQAFVHPSSEVEPYLQQRGENHDKKQVNGRIVSLIWGKDYEQYNLYKEEQSSPVAVIRPVWFSVGIKERFQSLNP